MAADDFNPADLDELAEELRAAGFRSVEVDPAKVKTPGVWLRLDGFQPGTLQGLDLDVTVHLIVSERHRGRALQQLADAYNQAKPVLRTHSPLGLATPVGVVLPGSQTPLPGLAVPITFNTTQE